MNFTRRQFLKSSAIAGGVLAVGGLGSLIKPRTAYAMANSPSLEKWRWRMLTFGSDIPFLNQVADPVYANTMYSQVTAGQFSKKLHPDLPATRLWGYWDATNPVKQHLGGVILATRGTANRLRFTNILPNRSLVPVDSTLPGADAAQNRIAVHLHGGFIPWISDGGPFDWWDPNGIHGLSFLNGPGGILDNIPGSPMAPGQADYFYTNDQSTRLMWYHDHAHGTTRLNAYQGLATGYLIIDPDQEAQLVGKVPSLASTIPLVVQDKIFVDETTISTTDPTWMDVAPAKSQGTGSLWYEHIYDPATFRLLQGPEYLPVQDPSAIPEFFGDTMLVNGRVHPFFRVEPRAYRFMILNACNARVLNLNLLEVTPGSEVITSAETLVPTNATAGPPMVQIGTEGGYLVSEVYHDNTNFFDSGTITGNMLLAPAERSDFIIDFTGQQGREFILYNDAPGPFPDGPPENDYFDGNPATPTASYGSSPDTRQLIKFKVRGVGSITINEPRPDPNVPILDPNLMDPPPLVPYTTIQAPIPPLVIPNSVTVDNVRDLTLNEGFDQYGRLKQMIGTTMPGLVTQGFGLDYLHEPTEIINAGAVEVWRIFNLTADTHPIHFHLINLQILSRQPFRISRGRFVPSGDRRGPEPAELGWKETIQMHPGEVITLITKFDLPTTPFLVPSSPRATDSSGFGMGLPEGSTYHEYVYHCHILEHEEHDMMRPLIVKE